MHTLIWLNNWLALLHPIFETLFFISGLALAFIALKGLEQLRIAKQTAKIGAKREAFKLAAEQCRYFAERVVPFSDTLCKLCDKLNLTSFSSPGRKFDILNGEITSHEFPEQTLLDDSLKCKEELIASLNSVEAFSIFFAEGIAEESVAYRETGTTFCATMRRFMPAIYLYRKYGVRYESTVKLYELWNARMTSEKLLKQRTSLDSSLQGLKKDGIKTIGTHEF